MEKLEAALKEEAEKFSSCYLWLKKAMPPIFFQEIAPENMTLITHSLMGLELQDFYSTIHLKGGAIVLCQDMPGADQRILQHYSMHGIKNYQAFVSNSPLPFSSAKEPLRIATIVFTDGEESFDKEISPKKREELYRLVEEKDPSITSKEVDALLEDLGKRFIYSLPLEALTLAILMYFRAKTRDSCQYEIKKNPEWRDLGTGSLQIVLAWKNTPKHNFLYRLARTVQRHKLLIKRVDATYVDPYSRNSTLIMALDLHGANGEPAEEAADLQDFLRELITVKYFASFDLFDAQLVNKGFVSGNFANILRAISAFVHQALVHVDPHLYTFDSIEEGLCRHPELTAHLAEAFRLKFHPEQNDYSAFLKAKEQFLHIVDRIDTGQEENDIRRKNILKAAMSMIHHTLKTNAYRMNFTALSFRLDPKYLDDIPFDRTKKFPELPFAIFFIKGMHFFGYHIRFKDLARGGLRTVFPEQLERALTERNTIFTECYNLAYTQNLKNKDIPEGGAKGILFLKPYEHLASEMEIFQKELEKQSLSAEKLEEKILLFQKEQTQEYLYQSQRAFIENLVVLVNCLPDGQLRVRHIIDYWKKPEYLYLGPDENMHDAMIEWIAEYSKKYAYKPGSAFITSKPIVGINHKEYGVTSLGVNVYMAECLKFIGINPDSDPFTVKMAGGPDGDVAGNQILNLYKHYQKTAKLIALTDVSGTAYDPLGLDLSELAGLFKQGKAIHFYPTEKLSEGGFLVDKENKRDASRVVKQTVCFRKLGGTIQKEWLSSSETNHLVRENLFKTKTDVFIPAGGRPRTLNESNFKEYLDETGKPTSKVIIEGANLYLTAGARRELEKLGTLVVRDSSANKTGVISSSFEVLSGLTLSDELFYQHKDRLVKEILERLKVLALREARLLLKEHQESGAYLTDISMKISERINQFTFQILDFLEFRELSSSPDDPLVRCFLSYCLPLLRERFQEALLREIPDQHKKAIIACHVGADLVYRKGLKWFPSVVDILPSAMRDIGEV